MGLFASSLADLKYAVRILRRQPAFSLAVAATLALGLGLNATVLGMMDGLLFRPYQFRDYQRLVVIWETPRGTTERQLVSPADFREWRLGTATLQPLVAWEGWGPTLTERGEPERIQGFRVSPGFFEALSINPVIGRSFTSTEEQPGHDRSVIIGDGLWKQRFGGNPAIVGTEILVDGEPYTVVGVGPPGFDFPVGAQAWAPLALTPERATDRRNRTLTVLGKLRPGRSLADAQAEMDVISRRLEQQYPDTNGGRSARVRTLSTAFREGASVPFVAILQAGAALVLLIACANLAGLLLAQANDRQREIAVRAALGAGKLQIARQLMTETVLLALVASALALVFARIGLDVLRSSMPAEIAQHIEGWNNVRLADGVAIAIPAVAIGLGLLVGLIPALAVSRTALTDALRDGDRGAVGGGAGRQRTRHLLVVAEIAFALALLVAAGLATLGGIRMVNEPGGFDADRLLTFEFPMPENKYRDASIRRELTTNLLSRIEAVPGVEGAALANVLPAAGWSPAVPFIIEEEPISDPARRPRTGFRAVSPGFFGAMRVPMLAGRSFSPADREGTQPVAIVSASFASRFWAGRDPIGKRLRLDDSPVTWVTVVGVAGDVTMYNWWDGIDYSAVYVPLRQATPAGALAAVVRTRGEPTAVAGAVRAAVAAIDPLLAIHRVRTMHQGIASSTFGLTFIASLLAICGGLALVLSCIGIASMMAHAVSRRRREFGVRLALGATPRDVLRLVLRQAGVLTAAGLAVGLILAMILARLMSSALFGVVSLDPATFVGVTLALGVVSLAAAYAPVRRSLRLDPAAVLRDQ